MLKKMLSKKKPEKRLTKFLKKKAGRGTSGKITVKHRGGGVKRLYRIIDFGEEKKGQKGKVLALEYDPYRTAYIMLVEYSDGEKRYLLAPFGIRKGDEIICDQEAEIKTGNRILLKNIPIGTMVYNIEIQPGQGGRMVRSAGSAAKVLACEGRYVHLEMPSGEVRKILKDCFTTIGQVSHPEHRFENVGKAGRARLKGWRPTVRGSAMNPVDHPHGGGEGKAPIGLKYSKTAQGKPALGVRTRRRKWTDKYIVKRRRKKRK